MEQLNFILPALAQTESVSQIPAHNVPTFSSVFSVALLSIMFSEIRSSEIGLQQNTDDYGRTVVILFIDN